MKQYKDTRYYITENGEVYSKFGDNFKLKKPYLNRSGYYYIKLELYNKSVNKRLHRLIAECYIPNPDNKPQVNHINGDKTDNRVDNLEWVTHYENNNHSLYILNNLFVGEYNGNSKLTEEQVKWIRNLYIPRDRDYGCRAMAKIFNVNPSLISKIIKNKMWKHI